MQKQRLCTPHPTPATPRGGNNGGTWEPSSQKAFCLAESFWGFLPLFVTILKSLLRIPKYDCRLAFVCRLMSFKLAAQKENLVAVDEENVAAD